MPVSENIMTYMAFLYQPTSQIFYHLNKLMNVCNHFCTQRHFAPSVLLYFMCVFPFVLCRIIFLFHKNGHLSYKAKVKPPRLDGQRVGVYSTRSPHRPNVLGLTLAKLDKIEGKLMQKRFENVTLN